MLEELKIQNFAIVDSLELLFDGGFNVITGETGAGKSILIDAVELLLGGKADPGIVRAGKDRTIIEGVFSLNERSRLMVLPLLEEADLLESEDNLDYITLSREIRTTGRSTARINGVTVRAELLREVGEVLVDIHGQSDHLSLFKPRAHLSLIDRFANLHEPREALAEVVSSLIKIRSEMKSLQQDKDALQEKAERLRYEIDEINAASLDENEEDDIITERNRLGNSEQLAKLSGEALELLSGEENEEAIPAVDALMQVASLLGRLSTIDDSMSDDYNLAEELSAGAQELALTLSGYIDDVEYDPDRLNELEERLEVIRGLKRRYRANSIAEILNYAERATSDLASIEHSDERLEELEAEEDRTLHHIGELCKRISTNREKAGETLSKRVVRELKDLRMERATFEVVITQDENPNGCYVDDKRYNFDTTGMDTLEFMMSANPGEPLRPLAKVASGGEAARIMLALKRVLSQADETPLLIFDEIDQGIGGRIGAIVGEKLWSLTDSHQVMVVTHLPQLAGFGDKHYRVHKEVSEQRTITHITPLLDDETRVGELAEMLGTGGESGVESARLLLDDARHRKNTLRPPRPVQQDMI